MASRALKIESEKAITNPEANARIGAGVDAGRPEVLNEAAIAFVHTSFGRIEVVPSAAIKKTGSGRNKN